MKNPSVITMFAAAKARRYATEFSSLSLDRVDGVGNPVKVWMQVAAELKVVHEKRTPRR
jgi:hypothetical protein